MVKGIPFREAHGIVGAAVRYCIENGRKLEELSIEEFKKFSDAIGGDVYDVISIEQCVERRNSIGGTSSASTDEQLLLVIESLMAREEFVRQENEILERCWNDLLA